ncbi:DUF1559 family PulG-like putative transporter [Aureliella helgolandensis]|uniref:DUF1559 domain-containing protein n=1 Tax=Aureliella helgolandensis TaxID=2527968 RepID=A0A518G5D8_9BACT|nr:DUF1559 domain-containing protein [Aureliella helgolandensis]QDV23779.1 hypothetical protein Q31a_20840 [Aureliella helgolandensis]
MDHLKRTAIAITFLCMSTVPLRAADLTSLLDPNACLLLRIDVAKIEVPQLFEVVNPIVGEQNKPQMLSAQVLLAGVLQSLRDAKVEELYVSLATQDLSDSFPALIIPSSQPARVQEVVESLLAMVPPELELHLHQHPLGVVVAQSKTWQRMVAQANVQASGLRSHYQDYSDATMNATLGFNQDVKDAVVDVWPDQLPAELRLPLSPRRLMRDVDALSLVCEMRSQFSLSVVAACRDATSAAQMTSELQPVLQSAGLELKQVDSSLSVDIDQEWLNKLLRPLFHSGKLSTPRMQVSNNMKRIAMALHNFHSAFEACPPRMTVDESGRELLSWRVFLLPYLGEEALYKQFRLNEPWDSPHNRTLVDKMPAVFADVGNSNLPSGHTRLQVVLTDGSVWDGNDDRLLQFQDITDGNSNTVFFLVAPEDRSVVWSQPADFEVSREGLVDAVFAGRESVLAAYFDSSIRPIKLEDSERLHAQLTGNGGKR